MILSFELINLLILVAISLAICVTLCTLSMEASVLFTPAFLFVFPSLISGFPRLEPNEAIGLALIVEFFGYTSSVSGYWFRHQIDFPLAGKALKLTVPVAIIGRLASCFTPEQGLMLVFGILLLILSAILYRAHFQPRDGLSGHNPRTHLLKPVNPGSLSASHSGLDRLVIGSAGLLAGLVGIGIGEISNTFLTVRRRIPARIATGTSALILHITILSALVANIAVLNLAPGFFHAGQIAIPWRVAAILGPVVVVSGQLGSFINSRLSERTIIRALVIAYILVGLFVLGRTLI